MAYTNDWKGKSYHNISNSSHSRGVTILISESFEHKLKSKYATDDGRKLLINIEHNGQTYSIVNIYAPNDVNQRKDFLMKSSNWILDKAENDNCLILCGDFNCAIGDIDRKVKNCDRSRPAFKDVIHYLDINDSYRTLNKTKINYTSSKHDKSIQSRIDYIFCSQYIMNLSKMKC